MTAPGSLNLVLQRRALTRRAGRRPERHPFPTGTSQATVSRVDGDTPAHYYVLFTLPILDFPPVRARVRVYVCICLYVCVYTSASVCKRYCDRFLWHPGLFRVLVVPGPFPSIKLKVRIEGKGSRKKTSPPIKGNHTTLLMY